MTDTLKSEFTDCIDAKQDVGVEIGEDIPSSQLVCRVVRLCVSFSLPLPLPSYGLAILHLEWKPYLVDGSWASEPILQCHWSTFAIEVNLLDGSLLTWLLVLLLRQTDLLLLSLWILSLPLSHARNHLGLNEKSLFPRSSVSWLNGRSTRNQARQTGHNSLLVSSQDIPHMCSCCKLCCLLTHGQIDSCCFGCYE